MDKGLRPRTYQQISARYYRVSILGLVDKGLRRKLAVRFEREREVSILGLVDKGLRPTSMLSGRDKDYRFNPWFSG